MDAEQLRRELARAGEARSAHARRGVELDARLARLCAEAQEHPEVSMTEAARLAGLERRATAYELAGRAKG